MWYLILALLFGQGGQSTNTGDNNGQTTVQPANTIPGDTGGETSTPIPPRPPRP